MKKNDQEYSYDKLIDNTQENTDVILHIFYATDNPTVWVILVFLFLYLMWNKSLQKVISIRIDKWCLFLLFAVEK